MAAELRVILCGYGLAGRMIHAPLIGSTPGLDLCAIVTGNDERREQAKVDFPGARLISTPREAWAATGQFDVAVIASPNSAHARQTIEAIRGGMHVVVDKPLAGNAEQALLIAREAKSVNRQVHTFQNRRWDSDFLTLASIVDNRALGKVHHLESRMESLRGPSRTAWRDSSDPKDLGGVLLDLGSHLVDQAIHLLGPVLRVSAQLRAIRNPESAEDDARLVLTHAGGAESHLIASRASSSTGPRFLALCEGGEVRIEFTDSQEAALRRGEVPGGRDWGVEPPTAYAKVRITGSARDVADERIAPQRGRWDHFYPAARRAILTGSAPPVPLSQVIETMRVLDAARCASAIGELVQVVRPLFPVQGW